MKDKNTLVIGLFGSCGTTTWRQDIFIPELDEHGMKYFNPQVEDWTPACAQEEAWHLANDEIILFPVTSETYGIGSLSEVGFSILQALKLDNRREFLLLIDPDLDEHLKIDDPVLAKESIKQRALVIQHLLKLNLANVYMFDNMEDMRTSARIIYKAKKMMEPIKEFRLNQLKL